MYLCVGQVLENSAAERLESESSSVSRAKKPRLLRQPNSGAVCPHAKNQCHAADNR
ncbi:hypothetical protein EMIT0P253_160084 [Pseudomonas sp. IT-P253]